MAEWIEGWRKGVVPLRRKHGYEVEAAWVIREENRFLWVLSYDGPEDWASKNAAYYASPERKELKPDPARLIEKTEEWMLTPVPTT